MRKIGDLPGYKILGYTPDDLNELSERQAVLLRLKKVAELKSGKRIIAINKLGNFQDFRTA